MGCSLIRVRSGGSPSVGQIKRQLHFHCTFVRDMYRAAAHHASSTWQRVERFNEADDAGVSHGLLSLHSLLSRDFAVHRRCLPPHHRAPEDRRADSERRNRTACRFATKFTRYLHDQARMNTLEDLNRALLSGDRDKSQVGMCAFSILRAGRVFTLFPIPSIPYFSYGYYLYSRISHRPAQIP